MNLQAIYSAYSAGIDLCYEKDIVIPFLISDERCGIFLVGLIHGSLKGANGRSIRGRSLREMRIELAREKGTHTNAEWLQLIIDCGNLCVRCGAQEPLEKDHIVPIYQGGSDAIENIQPLCQTCNTSKGPESISWK